MIAAHILQHAYTNNFDDVHMYGWVGLLVYYNHASDTNSHVLFHGVHIKHLLMHFEPLQYNHPSTTTSVTGLASSVEEVL